MEHQTEPQAWGASPNLPEGVIAHVLTFLNGEAPWICAAACVSRAWHAASLSPLVWRTISLGGVTVDGGTNVAAKCTARRLRRLLHRAGDSLEVLDISGSLRLSDADIRQCLRLPSHPALRIVNIVRADDDAQEGDIFLTGNGIAEALRGRKLDELKVLGAPFAPPGAALCYSAVKEVLCSLGTIVRPPATLDVDTACGHCGALIPGSRMNACSNEECDAEWCDWCKSSVVESGLSSADKNLVQKYGACCYECFMHAEVQEERDAIEAAFEGDSDYVSESFEGDSDYVSDQPAVRGLSAAAKAWCGLRTYLGAECTRGTTPDPE